jgi:hypothetical protein
MRRIPLRKLVSTRRLRVVVGATAVSVILAVPAGAAGPGWSRVPTPNPLAPTGQLFGVSCPSETACVGVGSSVGGSGTGVSLAERWDGTSWSTLPTPNPPGAAASALVSVSCTSSSACVAVGVYVDSSGAQYLLAELWNGSTWSLQSVPEPPGSSQTPFFTAPFFNAVSCSSASSCMAVGGYTDSSGTPVTLAEHWDGATWTMQSTPNPSGAQFSTLNAIECTSSSDCVAVGASDQGALAERWDGTNWSTESTPSPGQPTILFSVSCVSSSACVAVGEYLDSSGTFVTLAEAWDGTSWTVQSTPNPTGSQFAQLNSVSCSSASACTAVGDSSDSSNTFSTVAERWDGQKWSPQTTSSAPRGGALLGVACPQASSCIAVGLGFDSSGTVITLGQGWDGNQWSAQPTVSPQGARGAHLAGVSCKSSSSCVAVGYAADPFGNSQGTLAEFWDGTAWRIVPTPNPAGAAGSGLNGVSCTSPSACVAVGTSFDSSGNSVGALTERWDGTRWSIQPTPTSDSSGASLNAVSCTSPNACTAVGNNSDGQVMAEGWDGKSWSIQPMPAPVDAAFSFLTGVSCTSAKACTAVGGWFDSSGNNAGTVAERWNGTSWVLEPSPGSHSPNYFLSDVSCTSASACTAVGNTDSGLLAVRSNGATWTMQSPVTPPGTEGNGDFFNGVSCSTPSACTAVGLVFGPGGFPPSTVAERWDGTRWSVQPTPTLPGAYDIDPPAVSCPNWSVCTAVGSFTNNVRFFDNVGPKVILAEQWNGNGAATQAADNVLAAHITTPSPCARAPAGVSARPISTRFRLRPSIQTAQASSREIKALIECRGTA